MATPEQRTQMLLALAELSRRPPRQRAAFAARAGIPGAVVDDLVAQARAWGLRVAEEGEAPAPEDDGGAAFAAAAEAFSRAAAGADPSAADAEGAPAPPGVRLGTVASDAISRFWMLAFWLLVPAAVAFAMRRRGMTLRDLYRSLSREFLA
jgi:hypothetical protein